MRKKTAIFIGVIFLAIVAKLIFGYLTDDLSETSKYDFFDVPITKQMAESLKACKPYDRNYTYPLFKQIWVPYYKGHFRIKIKPLPTEQCRISTRSIYKKVEYEVPMALVEYIGNLMLTYCFSSNDNEEKLRQFVSCMKQDVHYSTGNQYIVDSLQDVEEYIAKWDSKNVAKVEDYRRRQFAKEEQICREKLSTVQNSLKSANSNPQKSYHKTEAVFSVCEFTIDAHGEVKSYSFVPIADDKVQNEYRLTKCW